MPHNYHTMESNNKYQDNIDEIIAQIKSLRRELKTGPVSRAQLQQETKATNQVMHQYDELFKSPPDNGLGKPPGKEELGKHTWTLLHTMAAYWPQAPPPQQVEDGKLFIELLSRLYPCTDCAGHFRGLLEKYPPRMQTQKEFIQWLSYIHNKVNNRLGKPHFHTKDHQKRWWNQEKSIGDH